jgi:hypothetical protein
MFFRRKSLRGVTRVSLLTALSLLQANGGADSTPRLTPAAAGPYQIDGNRILDATGRAYLVRGTELPTLTLKDADIAGDGKEFGAFSPSSLISIRQRLNMNAVRLPVRPLDYLENSAYRGRLLEVVESANAFELLVILAVDPAGLPSPRALVDFWARCAGDFKHHPNVFFAVAPAPGMQPDSGWSLWQSAMQTLVDAVRSGGAQQPILLAAPESDGFDGLTPQFQVHDRNVVYEATPRYATMRTDADRWRQFGSLSMRAPVLVNDLDPRLDTQSAECPAFPGDPGTATRLVQENLAYFDAHQVSWVLSSYRPGKMLTEYRYFNWSKLDDGWTCGESPSHGGIAMTLVAHLWSGDPHGLFAVNHVNGGLVLARGGLATAYGPILAEREVTAPSGRPLPLVLGNVSVRVTDSRGIARLARLQYTGAGWSDTTFVVPADAAVGAGRGRRGALRWLQVRGQGHHRGCGSRILYGELRCPRRGLWRSGAARIGRGAGQDVRGLGVRCGRLPRGPDSALGPCHYHSSPGCQRPPQRRPPCESPRDRREDRGSDALVRTGGRRGTRSGDDSTSGGTQGRR